MSEQKRVSVGIDVGTTISAAACVDKSGQPATIQSALGERLVPSALYFGDDVIVGDRAMMMGVMDPDAFAECFKRDIGKSHYQREVRQCRVPPEVLTAFLLRHMRANAESRLGSVREAVITVPAYFDEKRRTITQQAAALADLKVTDIINEPTAAAIAYAFQMQQSGDKQFLQGDAPRRIMIYDLGGGTFDVTLLEYSGRTFRTLATDGDVMLGGRDFDERLAALIAERFMEKHGLDPRSDQRDMQKLWQLAQETKHALTTNLSRQVTFSHAGLRIGFEVTRQQFEDAIEPLVERTLTTSAEVLREAALNWSDLDEMLLVGGSSRLPLVSRKLQQMSGRAPRLADNPDEMVAQGAALYAAMLDADSYLDSDSRFSVVNVNAHSLGVLGVNIATNQRINKVIIPRNTPLPASKTRRFVTHRDGQPNVTVRLLEGESEDPLFCMPVGDCVVQLDPPLPKGADIEVSCRYDANGTISVSARIPATRKSAHVELRRDGVSTLEPLEVWRTRLTTGDETATRGKSNQVAAPQQQALPLSERPGGGPPPSG